MLHRRENDMHLECLYKHIHDCILYGMHLHFSDKMTSIMINVSSTNHYTYCTFHLVLLLKMPRRAQASFDIVKSAFALLSTK